MQTIGTMSATRSFRGLALATALAAVAVPAAAAVPAVQSSADASILTALTLQKLEDMDFGGVTVTTAGTAVIDPVTNTLSTTGGVAAAFGTPHAAKFEGAASGGPVVNLKVPKQPVTMTRVGGTETILLTNFTLDGSNKRVLAQSAAFDFRVGGTITIAAGQAEGTYVGTFDVTAQYP